MHADGSRLRREAGAVRAQSMRNGCGVGNRLKLARGTKVSVVACGNTITSLQSHHGAYTDPTHTRSVAVLMEAEGLTDVLGLDPDFAAEGFRLLP